MVSLMDNLNLLVYLLTRQWTNKRLYIIMAIHVSAQYVNQICFIYVSTRNVLLQKKIQVLFRKYDLNNSENIWNSTYHLNSCSEH